MGISACESLDKALFGCKQKNKMYFATVSISQYLTGAGQYSSILKLPLEKRPTGWRALTKGFMYHAPHTPSIGGKRNRAILLGIVTKHISCFGCHPAFFVVLVIRPRAQLRRCKVLRYDK
jgi:hypothetical protein